MSKTTESKMTTLSEKVLAAANYEELAAVARAFAEGEGIELEGTYLQMTRLCPAYADAFRLFVRRSARLGYGEVR